jgi:Domain of unknown function (DUF5658)
MARRGSWGAEQTPNPSAVGGAATVGRRGRWPMTRPSWLLLILLGILQVADIVTTNYALATRGVWEANPLVASWQAHLGAAWWLPKLAIVGLVCFATPLTRRRWAMICVVSVYAAAVAENLAHL